jgi:uncharacterized protein YggE
MISLGISGASYAQDETQSPVPLTKPNLELQAKAPEKTEPKIELKEPGRLTISSQGSVVKPADQLQLHIGVVTISEKAGPSLEDNSIRVAAVVKNLQSAGLSRSDFETGNFTIQPTFTPMPKDPPPDWQPSINGYEVRNNIIIHTDKLELAGKLIDAANKAGANTIDNMHFVLKDPRGYWGDAIKIATLNAISDANIMAQAAQVRLGRIISIVLENVNEISPRPNMFVAKAMGNASPTIEPGEVTISANVTVTYEINP